MVTGAARGIGRAIAERLQADGWKVLACDQDPAIVSTARDVGCDYVVANVADIEDVRRMFDAANKRGHLSVLVNNAGINHDALLHNLTDDAWQAVLDVNLTGTFLCMREASSLMVAAGWGRIINISSVAVLGAAGASNYAASKAAILALTRSAALELGGKGVTVNAIAPGAVRTSMFLSLPEEFQQRTLSRIPLGRIAEPREIASVVSVLASEDSSYITGQTIFVDGGLSLGYV